MNRLTLRRPSPALVLAFVALSASLVGTAAALPGKNRVDKNDIRKGAVSSKAFKKGAVTSRAIKKGAVTARALRASSVRTAAILDNAVTGTDINESTLGAVPQVSFLKPFKTKLTFGQDVELIANGPVSFRAACLLNATINGGVAQDGVVIYATSSQANAFMGGLDDRSGDADGDGPEDAEHLDPPDIRDDSVLTGFGLATGGPAEQVVSNSIDNGWVLGPEGSYIGLANETTVIGLRPPGSDCLVAGTGIVFGP